MFITTNYKRKSDMALEAYKPVVDRANIFAQQMDKEFLPTEASNKPMKRLEKLLKSSPIADYSDKRTVLFA